MPFEIDVTVTVNSVPVASDELVTVTSLDADIVPVPTDVFPTLSVTDPAEPVFPPNFALNDVIVREVGNVTVNVILVAELLPEPT